MFACRQTGATRDLTVRRWLSCLEDRLAEGLWMSTAGGDLSKTTVAVDTNLIDIPFEKLQIRSGQCCAPHGLALTWPGLPCLRLHVIRA